MSWVLIVVLCVIAIILLVIFVILQPGRWFRALISGTYVPMAKIIAMRMKKLDTNLIINSYIKARKSGVKVTVDQLENHAQARGNVDSVVDACIAAVNAHIELAVETAMALDLAGRDINEAVKDSITPKVIHTQRVTTVCKNGIELTARAKVTIRANLNRLIGTALEETINARVMEAIVGYIGAAVNHNDILEHPNKISHLIARDKKITADAAYDILSIDINEIEVGRNIGAELEIDRAEMRKLVAQADAEQRRSEALASEQEMRAITQEMRARVVAAEALLPAALADALDKGSIGVQDYYGLQNTIADTEMRKQIAGTSNTDMLPAPRKKSKLV